MSYIQISPIGEMLRDQAAATPDKPALEFEGRVTTYAELSRRADQVAQALKHLSPGAHVGFLGKNSDLYFQLLFGAARAGLITTALNWRLASPELRFAINDAQVDTLFVGADFEDAVRAIAAELPTVKAIVAMDGAAGDWPAFEAWRDGHAAQPPPRRPSADEVVLQLYTSGTTGLPKGAMLTSRSLMAIRDPAHGEPAAWNDWTADDVSLVAMPVFHIAGTGSALDALLSGSGALSVILKEFNADAVLELMGAGRLTKMFLVPAVLQVLVGIPRVREIDHRGLKSIFYGASPMPLQLLQTCLEVFAGVGFVQVYGLTEVSGYTVVLAPEDHVRGPVERLRSAGRALPGVELAVVAADGGMLPAGEVGEILMRGDMVMRGYWNRPQATAETIDRGGWLHTGDAGYLDAEGYLFIQDRVKDMIVSGGENVYPAEVESAIFGCPGVADVAVIGVPDPRWGEAVKALVVPATDAELTAAEVVAWARERIAGYKLPKSVEFVPPLPRNASGKVLRRELREPYWKGVGRRVN